MLISLIKVCKINPLHYFTFSFQSPFKYVIFVLITSLILKIPRFFHFKLIRVYEVPEYWTTVIMEDPIYIRFSSYWDDLFVTGVLPLGMAIFFNLKIYLKVNYQKVRMCLIVRENKFRLYFMLNKVFLRFRVFID